MFGTGYPGAELERLARATDPRLKERVYAYVDEGAGIRPESGVGAYAHRIDLRNLYDAGADPLRLGRADANAMESAILDAGFDGYYVPRIFNNQGVAVVMGPASRAIAVEPLEIGATSAGQNARQQAQAAPGSTIGRKEGSEYVLRPKDAQEGLAMAKARPAVAAEAPSLRMEFGEYRVGEAEREAANRALEAAGLSVRFSGKQGVDWVKFDRESGTLGIPRSRMPQVKMDDRAALVQFLRARGIDYEITEVDPAKLKPTQAEFSMSKVERAKNVTGDTATALISSDDYVLDGHHRWIAQIVKGEPLRAIRFDSRIGPLMEEVYRFPSTKTSDGSEDQPTISMAEFRERAGLDAVAFSGKQGERPPRAAAKLITPRNRADLETFAAAAFRDGRTEHELGMVLSPSSPHQALTMMGAGQQQPVTLMGNYAWHIKNNHPDITASDIASVPELLKRPRAIINYGGGKISVIVDRRDGEGRPMLVGLEKVQRGSRNEQRLTDMHTMFGWDDPVAEIIKAAQMKTAAVWLPSQEVSRVEGITAGDYLRRAGDLPASSPPSAPYTSGAAEPRGRNGRATSVSVLSDEALRKFASGDKGWANAKVTIAVDPKVDLTGVNFSRKQPPAPNAFRTEPLPEEGKGQAFRRVTQDQFIRMRQLREWALANGATLSAASDVYGAEERMHGRVANKVQDFRDKVVKPLIEKVEKAGFTMDQVEEVLHATHAEERNKQVAKINPQMPDGGSGMKTADARAILARTSPELKRIAAEFQQITTRARDILLQAGIISQDTADAWDAAYKHYVPLKGGDDEDAARRSGTGKGLSVNGKTKRALGHGERDEAIVENILRDYERAVTLAEKNRVGQAMMLWLTELADQRIGTVDQPKKRAVLMPNYAYDVRVSGMSVASFDTEAEADKFVRRAIAGGQPGAMRMRVVKVAADPSVQYRATPMLEENEAQVYVNGHAIRMQLNDPLLAQAYKRLDADRLGKLLQISREINTFLARAYTGYNPTFIIVNPIRDFGSGVVKMTGNYGAGTTAKVVARYPKALGTLLRHAYTGKSTPALDRYRASGGTTGAGWLGDIDRIGRDIQRDYENYQGAIEQVRRGKPMAAARVASSKLIGGLVGWIEKLNMATENAMRFAAFEQVLKETGSVEQAGSAAKNITLNFNRKGEMGSTLSALYLFFNPAIQDTASIVDMLSKGKHRYQAMALIGAMAGLAFAAAALQFGGDDEDYERWKRIPPNIRERNLIIRTGEDTYVKIPVPFGFGWFHGLGNAMFELQHDEPTARIAMGLTSSFLTHFSPIGNPLEGAETMSEVDPLQMLRLVPGVPGTGELGRAGISLLTNRNAFGSEVVPDSKFDEGRPDHMRMFRTTKGTAYDLAARKLSDLTGGTETQAGAIDVSPETLKFWVSTITGGTGTFLSDTAHLAGLGVRAVANPDDPNRAALKPEPREIPVGKAFYAQEGVTDSRRSFWEAANEAKDALQDFSRARKAGDIEGADRIRLERGEVMALGKAAAAYGKMVSKLRDRVEEINADETTSLAYKRAAIRQIEKEEAALYERFLQSVTAAREADRARQVNER